MNPSDLSLPPTPWEHFFAQTHPGQDFSVTGYAEDHKTRIDQARDAHAQAHAGEMDENGDFTDAFYNNLFDELGLFDFEADQAAVPYGPKTLEETQAEAVEEFRKVKAKFKVLKDAGVSLTDIPLDIPFDMWVSL